MNENWIWDGENWNRQINPADYFNSLTPEQQERIKAVTNKPKKKKKTPDINWVRLWETISEKETL